ncbi:zinc-binding dehydrogenase [Sphingobium chlorophenolicum]|nr:zinc-binding dehydrogenase [Sphingobium chlorophenolicum]
MRSTIAEDGGLTVTLHDTAIDEPANDEIIVRIEATPINPSDLSAMIGPADLSTLNLTVEEGRPQLSAKVPAAPLKGLRGRLGLPLPVGNEGAGTVVATGPEATALLGKRVGMMGGGMYADYRKIRAPEVLEIPDHASTADGASMFINPLTALGLIETAKAEGHRAIVQTAAASNLGQMMQKICHSDGIALINIVRSKEQESLLRDIGAEYVLNSSDPDFIDQLTDLLDATSATAVFDAIGGGTQGSDILQAMEQAAVRHMPAYNRYGSDVFRHLFLTGVLDTAPVTLRRMDLGNDWSVTSWLLFHFLRKAGPETERRLRQRVVDELTTTFASHYSRTVGLADALEPELIQAVQRKSTGEKVLIDPTAG